LTGLSRWTEIVAQVRQTIAAELDVDPTALTRSTRFVEDLAINARQSARLWRAIEDRFGVELPNAQAPAFATVGDLTTYVETHATAR